jgi:hypothetical protein
LKFKQILGFLIGSFAENGYSNIVNSLKHNEKRVERERQREGETERERESLELTKHYFQERAEIAPVLKVSM